MLIEFSATNFRSIADRQVLSLIPDPKEKGFPDNKLERGRNTALNAIALYGANASGKSNFLQAIYTLEEMASTSNRFSSTDPLPYQPFLLREGYSERPTKFELVIAIDEKRYRYVVEYNETNILGEWLFRKSVGREVTLFGRQNDIIDPSPSLFASAAVLDAAIEATKSNTLFLSVCDAFNIKEAKKIIRWFGTMQVIDGLDADWYKPSTARLWNKTQYRPLLQAYLESMRLGMQSVDLEARQLELSELNSILPESLGASFIQHLAKSAPRFVSQHQMYRADDATPSGKTVKFDWETQESAGSQKILVLSGPVVWALVNGGVLIIDEIEAKSHPILTLALIERFLSKDTNPLGAQLIFATHDTNVLSYSSLRLDQIYFAEKNSWESTNLYSLSDFENPTPLKGAERHKFLHMDKERKYLEGRYGAIPFLSKQ